jgi:TrmH family RNA methyltransferase
MTLPPTITSRQNQHVKELRAAFSGKAGKPGDVLGIEGEHLLGELIKTWGSEKFEAIYVREGSEHLLERPALAGLRGKAWLRVSREVFDGAVDTETPQGIAATIVLPEWRALDLHRNPGVVMVLEDIQDPGNFGTLVRSADAFGVPQIFATPGCVNAWNGKAMRASAGSVFRVAVVRWELQKIVDWLKGFEMRMLAAVAKGEDASYAMQASLLAPCAVCIGNEGAGLSERLLAAAAERVYIPALVESLNAGVAGSILLYEAFRQKMAEEARR